MESTVVEISIPSPSIKPVLLSLSRISFILKTPKKVFFLTQYIYFVHFYTFYLLFYTLLFFSFITFKIIFLFTVCCLLGCGAFSSVKLVRCQMKTKATTTKRRSMVSSINDGGSKYQYFAMKMMTRSYIVENGWEHMVEQERLAMVSI